MLDSLSFNDSFPSFFFCFFPGEVRSGPVLISSGLKPADGVKTDEEFQEEFQAVLVFPMEAGIPCDASQL